jgi:hypothetical protein
MTQPCGALLPQITAAGWECNGVGLIIVTMWKRISGNIPIVLPRRALEIIDPEPWWDSPIRDFTGGDHAHLCVPRRPTDFRGDTTMVWGSSAMRFKRIGAVLGSEDAFDMGVGGELFVGPVKEGP